MALPISVTYTFATATSAIPLSQLDANFSTVVNGVNGIGNGTNALSNVVVTGGTIDGATIGATTSSTGRFSTVTATTGNITTINATTINSATVRSDTSLTFQSNGTTTAMTIDASQNVGIGTTSPARKLDARSTSSDYQYRAGDSANPVLSYDFGRENTGGLFKFYGNQTGATGYIFSGVDGERARIDSSGNLLVGKTAVSSSRFEVSNSLEVASFQNTGGTGNVRFLNSGGTTIGYIQWSGSTTSYVTSSDYRLKHSVTPMTTGLATVSALKPVSYKWNADDSDGEGFIAHELQEVIPLAVTGEKDAVNEDGTIKPQGVDYSKIVVHLVAAIQELKAEIDALRGAK